ncbi:hypothetical protein DES49_1870 [Halospina denitrificans]|uniref:Uncharacterized protein n=2 Tax=Halospina denitrificans TaxID=332522 RepID=A0A4V3EQG0_9GAMM|nr:hypothetical protein DES49_1870 [Halospina denitrificans]
MADCSSSVAHDMQNSETGEAAPGDRHEQDPERAFSDEENDVDGTFADAATFFTLIGVSARDTAQLLGLETRLVFKTVFMMMVLGVVLGLVILGVWLSITLIVAAGLYEYTGLGMTLSIAAASLVNVSCVGALLLVLKRLARRLVFPETRLAVRTLLDDASRNVDQQE